MVQSKFVSDVIQTQICRNDALSLFSVDTIILILNLASEVDLQIITWFTNLAGNLFLSVDDTCVNCRITQKQNTRK